MAVFEIFTKHEEQRVAVFVDVQNLYYSARNIYNSRVNFSALLKESVGERKLVRATAYVIRAQMPEEQTFFDALSKAGFEVKAKDLQVFYGGIKKGDWDVGITMDAIRQMGKVDSIVLASGDGDYVPLLEYIKNFGVRAEVIAFGKSSSNKLLDVVDSFIDMDEQTKKFLIPIKK
ncbi:MAG: NYN domain-containing protein [Candidatus Doudnabacteria bacterium]|nr:NYN domain-containing protein [Candidatus Doudnabacteria bacterium]